MEIDYHQSYKEYDDHNLINLVLSGNNEAMLFLLFDRYAPLLKKLCHRYYGDVFYLEQLQVNLLIHLKSNDWHALRNFGWRSSFGTWLGTVAGHLFIKNHMLVHTLHGLLQALNTRAELSGSIVTDLIDAPFNRWYCTSGFIADRAEYLCYNDMAAIRNIFLRLRQESPANAYNRLMELSYAHPCMGTRLEQLTQYSIA